MRLSRIGWLVVLVFTISVRAQVVFCPPGAKWSNLFGPAMDSRWTMNYKISYERDSVVNGQSAKVLRSNILFAMNCDAPYGPDYKPLVLIRQSGDTIFMRNDHTLHTWQVLYNFNAAPGDMWIDSLGAPGVMNYYTTFVTGVADTIINAVQLKMLRVVVNDLGRQFNQVMSQYSGPVIERLGFSGYLFPFNYTSSSCDSWMFRERLCYSDNAFAIQFGVLGCDMVGLEEQSLGEAPGFVYPNPVDDRLYISQGWHEDSELRVTDVSGAVLWQGQPSVDGVSLASLAAGLYHVALTEPGGQARYGKLVKR